MRCYDSTRVMRPWPHLCAHPDRRAHSPGGAWLATATRCGSARPAKLW